MQLAFKVYECEDDHGYYIVKAGVTSGQMFHDLHLVTDKQFEVGENIIIELNVSKTTADVELRPYNADSARPTLTLSSGVLPSSIQTEE